MTSDEQSILEQIEKIKTEIRDVYRLVKHNSRAYKSWENLRLIEIETLESRLEKLKVAS